jgi:uncharacterized protein (DUF2236 family)
VPQTPGAAFWLPGPRTLGRMPQVGTDAPLLGPDTEAARVLSHPGVLLGGPRALLMQVAHPKVAAGVAQHSDFSRDPFRRLGRTMRAMDTIAFGSAGNANRALRALGARHSRVGGTTSDGSAYAATDPDLLLWVHATLVDTVLAVDRRYLGVLSGPGRHRFYAQSRELARAFGIPDDLVPPDLAAFRAYMAAAVGALEVGPEARAIARLVIRPPLEATLGLPGAVASHLLAPVSEALTADLLPGRLRRAYGLRRGAGVVPDGIPVAWSLDLAAVVSRAVAPRLPLPSRRKLTNSVMNA